LAAGWRLVRGLTEWSNGTCVVWLDFARVVIDDFDLRQLALAPAPSTSEVRC
jgi:hypothetical protein